MLMPTSMKLPDAHGRYSVVLDKDISSILLDSKEQSVTVTVEVKKVHRLILVYCTRELIRQDLFFSSLAPVLKEKGFIVFQELNKLIPTFGSYSEYAGSAIDLGFIIPKNIVMEPASLSGL